VKPRVFLRVALAFAAALSACGDDAPLDAGPDRPPRLTVVGDDLVGLAPGETQVLQVRYADADDRPIRGSAVQFTLVPGVDGTAGGATLSARTVSTDAQGLAEVTVVAGPERVDFQVAAEAPRARATFYVSVSDRGFARLTVWPEHVGRRPAEEVTRIELRLYLERKVGCASVDRGGPAGDGMAPRAVPGFDQLAEWAELPAEEGYTLVAWAIHAVSGRAVAFACAPLAASQVRAGELQIRIAVADHPLELGARELTSTIDLAPLTAAIEAAGADRPWRVLGCADGGGQLLLDALLPRLDPGDADALAARRGPPAPDGCRPATVGTTPSLDALVDAALTGSDFPTGAARAALVAARDRLVRTAALRSRLGARGAGLAEHALVDVAVGAHATDLAASPRPVVSQPAAWRIGDDGVVAIDRHGFTARLGSAAGDDFAQTLGAAGVDPDRLGAALAAAGRDVDRRGCAAVSSVACGAAHLAIDCAVAACGAAAAELDGALTDWWRLADGVGLDLFLAGTGVGPVADVDGDLVVDSLGGRWDVTAVLADGAEVALTADFGDGLSE